MVQAKSAGGTRGRRAYLARCWPATWLSRPNGGVSAAATCAATRSCHMDYLRMTATRSAVLGPLSSAASACLGLFASLPRWRRPLLCGIYGDIIRGGGRSAFLSFFSVVKDEKGFPK